MEDKNFYQKNNLPLVTPFVNKRSNIDGKYFQERYKFMRIKKIENNQMRNNKYNQKTDRRKRT